MVRVRSLHELDAVKRALRERHERAHAEARRLAEAAEHAARERDLFARSVGTVVPLVRGPRVPIERPRPAAVPLQRLADERQVLTDSISDEFDVESLLDTDEALSFRRPGVGPEVVRKLRRGVWVIQAECDLHGARRDVARDQLAEFLREALQQRLRCVRVVHGKGNGSPGRRPVLKSKVRAWLVQSDAVIAFAQARAADGGHGALVVLLRPSSADRRAAATPIDPGRR